MNDDVNGDTKNMSNSFEKGDPHYTDVYDASA